MAKRERIERFFLYGVFLFYLMFLVKILIASRFSEMALLQGEEAMARSVNLIPFHSIGDYLAGATENVRRFAWSNVVGNMILFVPLGMFLPLLRKEKRIGPTLLVILAVSLATEIIQGIFGLGTADVDDILLNCLGGLAGLFFYRLVVWLFRGEKNARTVLTVAAVLVGVPVLYYFFFVIQLRL